MVAFKEQSVAEMAEIYGMMLEYQQDPIGYFLDILGMPPEHIWSKMIEMAESIRDHQFTAIRAGHSVSKTFTMGRIITWYKSCFQPSTVISTAPSDNQVKNQLWREIHASYVSAGVKLGGKMTKLMWDMKPSKQALHEMEPRAREAWEKNFAIGFSTSPDSSAEHASKMQGWHNEHLLAVLDEACGILPQIWKTVMEALIVDENCKCVAIGNPTDPECEFAKVCFSSNPDKNEGNAPYTSDQGWNVITIAGTDTPNYKQRKRVIPGLATRDYVDRIVKKYGDDGDGTRYRIKGLFPTYKEGTYYGSRLAKAIKEHRVGNYPWVETAPVYASVDTGDMNTALIFWQFIRNNIRIIDDYWDNEGLGIANMAKVIKGKPYAVNIIFCGPELASGTAGRFQTGKSTLDIATELGIKMTPCIPHRFDEGIRATQDKVWPILEINKPNCSTFLLAAKGYGKKKNAALSTDEEISYHKDPQKTWHRHMMDALRHIAIAFSYMVIGEDILGKANDAVENLIDYGSDYSGVEDKDLLSI